MQVKLNNVHPDELIYPYVAKLHDTKHLTVVLFTGPKEGVILWSTDPANEVGVCEYTWIEEDFVRCEVTLS